MIRLSARLFLSAVLGAWACNAPISFDDMGKTKGRAGTPGTDASEERPRDGGLSGGGGAPGAGRASSAGGDISDDGGRSNAGTSSSSDDGTGSGGGGRSSGAAGKPPGTGGAAPGSGGVGTGETGGAGASACSCPKGNTCDSTGACIETCLNGVPCPGATPHCDPRGVCVQCNVSADCAATTSTPNCNPANGECVECVRNTQCAHKLPRCDLSSNACVKCQSNSDCPSEWPVCSPSGACLDN